MVKRARLLIKGRVQGVFYRSSARQIGQQLNLTGWVKNLPDGRVEIVVEGEEEKLEEFIKWCRKGPPSAVVDEVDVSYSEALGEFEDFFIAY